MKNRMYLLLVLATTSYFIADAQAELEIKEEKVLALNTNFSIPIAKFSFSDSREDNDPFGKVSLFNTIGAGVSFNFGKLTEIKETDTGNASNSTVSTDFANVIGLQVGFVYSADLSDENPTNSFAPTLSINVLDFQIGWGYELGDVDEGASRHFVTLSYGIPLQKLTKTGSIVLKKLKKKDEEDDDEDGDDMLKFF